VTESPEVASFTEFFGEVEPRLKTALCATFGIEIGMEATSQALVYGWEHWRRVRDMENAAGYLWRVGRDRARRLRLKNARRRVLFESVPVGDPYWFEPGLPDALARLPERQRTVVILVHGLGWTLGQVAELIGVRVPTVQTHAARGLARLRAELGVEQ
jgi:DNA-directed RNA polymerase specialized sigma24 family protein